MLLPTAAVRRTLEKECFCKYRVFYRVYSLYLSVAFFDCGHNKGADVLDIGPLILNNLIPMMPL